MQLTAKANTLCLLEILKDYTDSEHMLKMGDIIAKMKSCYGLKVDRRTIYSCAAVLSEMGYGISTPSDNGEGYCLEEHDFDASEIRILMDSVYTNKAIEKEYSKNLIEKLRRLLPEYRRRRYANLLVMNTGRKTDNKEVFLNIEEIDEAIIGKKKISFTYLKYDFDKKLKPRKTEPYIVSPFSMVAANERYYMIGKCDFHKNDISHFRIDKIKNIKILDETADAAPKDFSLSSYTDSAVFMYGGECGRVTFKCDNVLLQNAVDKFGQDAYITKNDDATFDMTVSGSLEGLLYWSLHYPDCCEIIKPQELREKAIETLKKNKYGI
ncbi:MAG: WYL domain-containing protein [Clostridiales bacterium]|nr:WYL domain-containing protein [Clostridiales bacterium]